MAQPLVKKDDDHDDELEYSPFMGIEKGAVLQEARVFNDPQLDPRRCSQVITKLLYLLNQGEAFTKVSFIHANGNFLFRVILFLYPQICCLVL
ncbi:PREDICTED: coatomer subunit gamma-like [Camelina sativa]|uniref:Coatomer subunit gamma-like n=1 Tax=Camelina sativa TaxID=90675 RepID=A0ABM1RDG6_CAMSA|nr:PREDICTED: coatomer subunit gamma-like [Camelina sativa]